MGNQLTYLVYLPIRGSISCVISNCSNLSTMHITTAVHESGYPQTFQKWTPLHVFHVFLFATSLGTRVNKSGSILACSQSTWLESAGQVGIHPWESTGNLKRMHPDTVQDLIRLKSRLQPRHPFAPSPSKLFVCA